MANAVRRLLFSFLFSAVSMAAQPRSGGECSGLSLEGRSIRHISFRTPFARLPWLTRFEQPLQRTIRAQLGKTFQTPLVDAALGQLEAQPLSPDPGFGPVVSASLATLRASNCIEENGQAIVDLDIFFIPGRIPAYFAYSRESRAEELANAGRAVGIAPLRFRLSPSLGYSASSRLVSGLEGLWEKPGATLESVRWDAAGSAQLLRLGIAMGGQRTLRSNAWKLSEWQAGWRYQDEPVAGNRFVSSQGYVNWKGATAALLPVGLVIRYGAELEGGAKRAPATLERARFVSARLYSGVTLRTEHQSLAASYGLQASGLGSGGATGFRKHMVDVAHGLSFSPNHYPVELDSRFSAGLIENLCRACPVPLADQFYAGNVEQNFLRNPTWVIRAQPFLRGMPMHALATAAPRQYWAVNLTGAVAAWRFPLIPGFLLGEPTFLERVDKLPDSVTALLASAYSKDDATIATDPALASSRNRLGVLAQKTEATEDVWTNAGNALPEKEQEDYEICSDTRSSLVDDLAEIVGGKLSIAALANSRSNLAAAAMCFQRFAPTLAGVAQEMEAFRGELQRNLGRTAAYERALLQARKDMLLARRTIRTLFHEANFASLSPVGLFDAVDLRGSSPALRRYSAGVGVRLTLVSTLRLTMGYASNLHRFGSEPRGAWFATLEVLNLFGR